MLFLQVSTENVNSGVNVFLQYGILGVFTLILIGLARYQEKQRLGRELDMKQENKELKQRVFDLEKKFDTYQEIDRKRFETLIEKNNDVLQDVLEVLKHK